MTTFKVGDNVRCIDSKGFDHVVTKGKIYAVTKVPHETSIEIVGDTGNKHYTASMRYTLVSDQTLKVGDHVVCVDACSYSGKLSVGRIYTILRVDDTFVIVLGDHGDTVDCFARRFKHAGPSTTPLGKLKPTPELRDKLAILTQALYSSFAWSQTPEGEKYWDSVARKAHAMLHAVDDALAPILPGGAKITQSRTTPGDVYVVVNAALTKDEAHKVAQAILKAAA